MAGLIVAFAIFATYCTVAGWVMRVKPYWLYLILTAMTIAYIFLILRSWGCY